MRQAANLVFSLILFFVVSCQFVPPTTSPDLPTAALPTLEPVDRTSISPAATPTQVLTPTASPRHLSVCVGTEPNSLFLYAAAGAAAQAILAAVYEEPFGESDFSTHPSILEKMPTLADGDLRLAPVEVQPGSTLVDADGYVNTLAEGIRYRPAGCTRQDCAQVYAGNQPVMLDQLVVDFHLRTEVSWSDSIPVKADDSVFSYEIARALYPSALPDLILRTASYQALDERTVEWKGVPGYVDSDTSRKFFSPLPRHIWGALPVSQLRTAEMAVRKPLGWGPYVIQEWVGGDHITLEKNPNYYRSAEGLPHFDHLVFRFVPNGGDALQALLAGECDLVDAALKPDLSLPQLFDLEAHGKLKINLLPDTAWEIALFGIDSLDGARPKFFASPVVRQAVGMCLDRQAVVDGLFLGKTQVATTFLPQADPRYNSAQQALGYDPERAKKMLAEAGWVDTDNNPQTPRLSQGVSGTSDGTPFEFDYLVSSEGERQAVAEILQKSLAQCGVKMNIKAQEAAQYLAPGPDGPVFGRKFAMAQFAWPLPQTSLCGLFLSSEIPGQYPDYPRGWGGADASGYSRAEYDRACKDLLFALPGTPDYQAANAKVQVLFAEDLPAIPLYWRFALELARPDICGLATAGAARNSLAIIEQVDYGEGCKGR